MNDLENTALCLKALSDPSRLRIISMLSNGELCACKLLEGLKISQPTLSHHMKILCTAKLVTSTKNGKWIHYELIEKNLKQLLKELTCIMQNKTIETD
ncbi:MAG: metalloregulator ArsR/SmtB family transcription factor [Synergistaceae bacterium]